MFAFISHLKITLVKILSGSPCKNINKYIGFGDFVKRGYCMETETSVLLSKSKVHLSYILLTALT